MYKVGDKIDIYQVINSGGYKTDHTGKWVAGTSTYGFGELVTVPLKCSEIDLGKTKLAYFKGYILGHIPELRKVATMTITKLK